VVDEATTGALSRADQVADPFATPVEQAQPIDPRNPAFVRAMPDLDPGLLSMDGVRETERGLLRHQIDVTGPSTEVDSAGVAIISGSPWPDLDPEVPLYHPTVIARVANAAYALLLEDPSNLEATETLKAQARWLRDNLSWRGASATWEFPMALPAFGAEPGWQSAMTNGFGLAALLQATVVDSIGDDQRSFLDAANGVLRGFTLTPFEGGVSRPVDDGSLCFEEVAVLAPTCVLNGHIFAVAGLDVAASAGSLVAADLRDRGVEYVRRYVDAYDAGFASRYSPRGKFAEPGGYNAIHVNLLLWLFHKDGDPLFFERAAAWLNFEPDPSVSVNASSSVDSTSHGPSVLSDGATWYGYWLSSDAAPEVELSVEAQRTICGVSVFAVGDTLPYSRLEVMVGSERVQVEPVTGVETNVNLAGPTTAIAYAFEPCVRAHSASFRFTPTSGPLAIREIDLLSDRTIDTQARYVHVAKAFDFGR